MKEKLTARQVQAIKTQNKIYKVALDLMEKNGFDNITVEDISKKAGVSVGAFYHISILKMTFSLKYFIDLIIILKTKFILLMKIYLNKSFYFLLIIQNTRK